VRIVLATLPNCNVFTHLDLERGSIPGKYENKTNRVNALREFTYWFRSCFIQQRTEPDLTQRSTTGRLLRKKLIKDASRIQASCKA